MSAALPPRPDAPVRVSSLGQQPAWQYGLLHDREEHTLIWLTRGQGRAIVSGLRRGLVTHSALFVPAGTLFALEISPQSLGLVLHCPATQSGLLPDLPMLFRVRDGFAQAELTGELDAMMREASQARPMVEHALDAHVQLIAVWLHRQLEAGTQDVPRDSAGHRLARIFASELSRGFRSDRGIADYAEALDVTPTHLTRTCRAACGKTAASMLAERKLHEARRLLLMRPGPPVNRIAESLGFHSAPYFTRFIRSHTGFSPTEIRQGAQRPGTRQSSMR